MSNKKPLCISIGPFGKDEIEQSYREDLEIVLKEALETKFEYKPFWAVTKIDMASDIFSNLIDAALVVADLRGLNPNVMYELGLRHAFNRPALHLIDLNTTAPWDIDKNYLIKYQAPLQVSQKKGLIDAIHERISKIEEIGSHKNPSFNTFYSHYKNAATVENFRGETGMKEILHVLLQNMDSMRTELDTLNGAFRDVAFSSNHRRATPPVSGWGNIQTLSGLARGAITDAVNDEKLRAEFLSTLAAGPESAKKGTSKD